MIKRKLGLFWRWVRTLGVAWKLCLAEALLCWVQVKPEENMFSWAWRRGRIVDIFFPFCWDAVEAAVQIVWDKVSSLEPQSWRHKELVVNWSIYMWVLVVFPDSHPLRMLAAVWWDMKSSTRTLCKVRGLTQKAADPPRGEALISHWAEIPDAESQQQDTTNAGRLL